MSEPCIKNEFYCASLCVDVAGQAGSDEYVSKIPNNKVCKGVVCTHMIYVMYLVL